jgi:DNA-binding transcriptional ArsR family regulator
VSETKRSKPVRRDPWYFWQWAHRTKTGNPARKLVLLGLAASCETSTGYGWVIPEYLEGFAECSPATVSRHLAALEEAGVIARRREYRSGKRGPDAFLLLADEWVAWPGDEPLVRETPPQNGHVPKMPTRVEVLSWGALAPWQQRVLSDLRRFADAKTASLDEVKALAACRDFPDCDHVGAAEKFAAWHIAGKGANRSRSDTNAAWRKWLQGEAPLSVSTRGASVVAETGDLDRFEFGGEA